MEIIRDRNIAAVLPRYTNYGDRTVIIDAGGREIEYAAKPNTILGKIGARCCKDLRLMRIWAGEVTYQRMWVPLAFSWELLLIPLRIRRAKVNGDATIGYFNFVHINYLEEMDGQLYLVMENEQIFHVLWNPTTAKKRLKDAALIHALLTHHLDDQLWMRLQKAAVTADRNIYRKPHFISRMPKTKRNIVFCHR